MRGSVPEDAPGGFDPMMDRLGKDAAGSEETELSIRGLATFPTSRVLIQPSAVCDHDVTPDRVTRVYCGAGAAPRTASRPW
jgi:hypothetical protein